MPKLSREIACAECARTFTATDTRAKFCSERCKSRAHRRPAKVGALEPLPAPAAAAPSAPASPPPGALVGQVAADLAKACVLDTIPGRAALALAYRVESPMETGSAAAALTRELSRLVLEAYELAPDHQDRIDDIDGSVAGKLRLVRGGGDR
jgi:hypothetical protein